MASSMVGISLLIRGRCFGASMDRGQLLRATMDYRGFPNGFSGLLGEEVGLPGQVDRWCLAVTPCVLFRPQLYRASNRALNRETRAISGKEILPRERGVRLVGCNASLYIIGSREMKFRHSADRFFLE